MSELNSTETDVLRWVFGLGGVEPLTLQEIGVRMERCRSACQIRDKAMKKLRQGKPAIPCGSTSTDVKVDGSRGRVGHRGDLW